MMHNERRQDDHMEESKRKTKIIKKSNKVEIYIV